MSEETMNDSKFGRLFILLIIAMSVLTAIIMVLASFNAAEVNEKLDARSAIENTSAMAERLAPAGQFSAETASVAPVKTVVLTGEEAYGNCAACHAQGIAGAPQIGNADAWSTRIAQGIDTLYEHAINGFSGSAGFMPAKGGNISLSDESVKAAVDYMLEKSK